jgi:hypothetical protein
MCCQAVIHQHGGTVGAVEGHANLCHVCLVEGSRLDVGAPAAFCAAHKSVRKSWDVPDNFPDTAVVEAYSNPKIDAAKDRLVLVLLLHVLQAQTRFSFADVT